ncbi:thiamine pyrophosphate enzyme, N-terminal TPP binding domain-containing protein [Pestalotiopsis sp. NC0098]|nr:thiamine pyrophosphate enzyme, N-terminal TPP binding domain-containing protein [Pestalotiopsis sp. NC0098]
MTALELVDPRGREFVGGDLLAQSLKHLGVNVAFGLHGGHLDAFLMGAHDVGITLVDTRHETVAVQAAEGYSKVKGEVGVCFVTANSGFCNGIPGLATAFADRSAVFCITASAPTRDAEMNVLQGFHDQVVLARPMTKFAHRVVDVEEIPRLVSHAFRTATSGAPGPVLIDFPIEILFSPVQKSRISWGSLLSPPSYPAGPHPEAISKTVGLLRASKRPIIVSGTGGRFLNKTGVLDQFLDVAKIPVFGTTKYTAPLPTDHPLRAGNVNLLTALGQMDQLQPDLIILIGCRTGFFMGSRSAPILPSNEVCKYVQIDTDSSEIGRSIPVDIGITSDAQAAVAALTAALKDGPYSGTADWVDAVTKIKSSPMPWAQEPTETTPGRLHPYHALVGTFESLEPGSIICIDGGEVGGWTGIVQESARAYATLFTGGYLGFLGNGWGYSLGAAIAEPSRQVVNIQGDGSAGFHLAELDTYARFSCNILTVVVNNYMWGMSNNGQEIIFGEGISARPASALSPKMGFAEVAKGLANAAEKVENLEQLKSAVKKLSQVEGPALLEIIASNKPTFPGTVSMVGATDDKNVLVIPYYDNVPRAYYK